jgi:hypothetical protein
VGPGTNELYPDPCGAGNIQLAISLLAYLNLDFNNFSTAASADGSTVLCGLGRNVTSSGTIGGQLDINGSGTLTGYMNIAGDLCGRFSNISCPVKNRDTDQGTCTVRYNGEQKSHVFGFL